MNVILTPALAEDSGSVMVKLDATSFEVVLTHALNKPVLTESVIEKSMALRRAFESNKVYAGPGITWGMFWCVREGALNEDTESVAFVS